MVGWDAVAMIGYDPAAAPQRTHVTTASGVEYAPRVTLERIKALGAVHDGFPILCHTLPASATVDGVLGLDFLRGKSLTLDFRSGALTLE